LRDLNHPFDQRLETGHLPEDATQAGIVSASTATRCRDVGRRLTGFDFDIELPEVRWKQLALRGAAISMSRSTTHCSDGTGASRVASGVLRDKRPLHHFPQLASEKKNCVPSRQRRSLDNKSARCAPSKSAHKKI